MATLIPILTGGDGTPRYNLGIAETYSWIPIANDQNRPMFARANYITNLSDLTVSISAGSFDIGAVHLLDKFNGNYATITQVGLDDQSRPIGAVNVLSHDLASTLDNIAIGDVNDNQATVNPQFSALNIFTVNGISAVSLTNQLTGVTVLNPVTSVNIKQGVTNWDVLSAAINNSTYTTLPSNPANEITILNNTGGTMYIKNASKTIGLPIDNNTSADFKLVGNTNEVAIKASSDNKTVFATFISYN
jgi:hypothetical protein